MPSSDNTLRVMAEAIMKLQAQVHAQDLLIQALYAERALQRGTFPQEAAEEVLAINAQMERGEDEDGFEGQTQHLADVQAAVRAFAMGLRARLEESQQI
ncbi:hypothetical protein [Aureimonas sp. ME7]|uniref:hypothetical protein n=1 Tax=Aureimonas sp. ME7 TaxID=2744252 RepID=UPI0015F575FC|nr:hypothetical protein [Aureimonas sp. ME7]